MQMAIEYDACDAPCVNLGLNISVGLKDHACEGTKRPLQVFLRTQYQARDTTPFNARGRSNMLLPKPGQ